jgi:hypothetical protein
MAVLLGTNTATGGGDFFGDGDMYGSRYQCVTSGSVDTLRILVGSSSSYSGAKAPDLLGHGQRPGRSARHE